MKTGFWFSARQNEIRKIKNAGGVISDEDAALLTAKWTDVKKSYKVRLPFYEASEADGKRYKAELEAKTRITDLTASSVVERGESNILEPASLPVTSRGSYIITLPVAESPPPDFRMEIGSKYNPGKPSLTELTVLSHGYIHSKPVTKVLLKPHSGRRHQLRLHTLGIGHPIVGDATYGHEKTLKAEEHVLRMALHAYRLTLPFNSSDHCRLKSPISVQSHDRFESFDYY